MGKSWSEQMIDLLVEEVMEVVGVGEGAVAVAEAVEVEAVEDVGVAESVSEID
jgi:hypothetical protein